MNASETLKKAAQLIREKGWWDGGATTPDTRPEALCAQQAISTQLLNGCASADYLPAIELLANRIKSLRAFSPAPAAYNPEYTHRDFDWVTQYNDSLTTPEPLLELMEMDDEV
jgi:hypothetical protein